MIKDNLDPRVSHQNHNDLYFWTATINSWQKLLEPDEYKDIVISSLQYLTHQQLVEIFGFVIMPNHIHLIWQILKNNGRESPQGSFLKFTAHEFKKELRHDDKQLELSRYSVQIANENYEFWQRDAMAIRLYDHKIAEQKLDYTHRNPTVELWKLSPEPATYRYSSAAYYETGKDEFGFLKNLNGAFGHSF